MQIFITYIFPYIAFLGTGVAFYSGGQQVNLVQVIIGLMVIASLCNPDILFSTFSRMVPLVWLLIASLPGTILLVIESESIIIPMQQCIGLLSVWLAVWFLFKYLLYSPEAIFKTYLRCAKFSSLVGITQQICFQIGFKPGYDLHWLVIGGAELDYAGPFLRVPSMFTEPSYFAAFLSPASYFAVLRISGGSRRLSFLTSLIIITAHIFTFSAIGYLGLLITILVAVSLSPRTIFVNVLLLLGVIFTLSVNPALFSRLGSLPRVLAIGVEGDENLSLLVNGINLEITKGLLNDRGFFGTGLGGYRFYSLEYLERFLTGNHVMIDRVAGMRDEMTLTDGGTMFFRLPSELGICGMLFLIVMLFRNFRRSKTSEFGELSTASWIYILVFSLRSGQLVRFELVFFCSLFILLRFRLQAKEGC